MKQFFPREINLHFNLRQPKSNRPTIIFLVVYINGKQYKLSTGVKVYPSQWDRKHEMAVVSWKLSKIDNKNNQIVNEKIKSIIFGFEKLFLDLCNDDDIVSKLNQIISMGRKPKTTIDIIEDLCKSLASDQSIEDSTRRTDSTTIRHLENFLRGPEAKKINIKNYKDLVKTEVFDAFRKSIRKLPRVEGGVIPKDTHRMGYANRILTKTKTLLKKYAVKDKAGYLTLTDINNLNLAPLMRKDESFDDNKVYLTNAEVMCLYRHKCDDLRDKIVRDLFLLECSTGFRFSDVIRLDNEKYVKFCDDGKIMIDILTHKTKERVKCEIYFDIARKILKKYRDIKFPKVAIGDYNKRIKRICRECGITDLCEQIKHYDGEDEARSELVEKCELVSSHTGRHTFIVLMRLRDIRCEDIQKYTGHKTHDMVLEYSNRMRASDKTDFQRLRKEHPEKIVLTCDEVDNGGVEYDVPTHTQTPITPSNTINDLQKLLIILGVDGRKVFMADGADDLEIMLYEQAHKLGEAGINVKMTKQLWNSKDLGEKEKYQKIIDVINN